MPRVYISGVKIPIQEVTWEALCDPKTRVTGEDPDERFPADIELDYLGATQRMLEKFHSTHPEHFEDFEVGELPWPRLLPRFIRPLAYPPVVAFECALTILAMLAMVASQWKLSDRIIDFTATFPDFGDYSWTKNEKTINKT